MTYAREQPWVEWCVICGREFRTTASGSCIGYVPDEVLCRECRGGLREEEEENDDISSR